MQNYFNEKYDLFWLGIFFTLFYLLCLGWHPLFVPDEGRYAEIAREMLVRKDFIIPRLDGYIYFEKPPFLYWLSALSMFIFGAKEWALRLPNAIIALGGLFFTFLIARRLFNRRAAWFASCVLGTSFLYFSLGHYINMDMAISVFVMGCLYCFMIDAIVGLYVFAALAVLTKGLIGLVLPGSVIVAWLIWTGSLNKFKRCLNVWGILIFLLISLPWHLLAQLKNADFINFYFIEQHFIRYLHGTDHLRTPKWALTVFFVVGLFPWTFFGLISFAKACIQIIKKKASDRILFLILWIAIIYSFFQFSFTVLMGYIAPVLPAFALLLGDYFDKQCTQETEIVWHRVAWILNSLLATCLATALGYFTFIQEQAEYLSNFGLQSMTLILSLLLLGFAPLFLYFKQGLQKALISLIILITLCLAQIVMLVEHFNLKTAKDIAHKITQDYPQARVVTNIHMQDLPFYLGRELESGKFPREFDFGLSQQNKPNYLLSQKALLDLWGNNKNMLLVIKIDDLNEIKAKLRSSKVLYANKRFLLVGHDQYSN